LGPPQRVAIALRGSSGFGRNPPRLIRFDSNQTSHCATVFEIVFVRRTNFQQKSSRR
jgi:hypothetical protein